MAQEDGRRNKATGESIVEGWGNWSRKGGLK